MAEESNFFTLMVVGDNPDELIKKYDKSIKVEPYVKYYYKDAGKLKKKAIQLAKNILDKKKENNLSDMITDYLKEKIEGLKKLSDFEYYSLITDGLSYNENGDAECEDNPDGKWSSCRIGRNLCIPFTLKDGSMAYQAKMKDIDWGKIHMSGKDQQSIVWKLYHKEIEPKNEQETKIYDTIKYQKRYFEGFNSEEEYINYTCSYWNYAYLDKNGWEDAGEHKNYDWITGFYSKYVTKINPNDIITIYECTK